MIEGLRVLPWIQDALSKDKEHFDPCDVCMQNNSVEIRQEMGCGFEPRGPVVRPWMHTGMSFEPQHCPVYTTALPEVHDVMLAVGSCGQGGLATLPVLCGGSCPPRALTSGCQLLMASQSEILSWKSDPKNKDKG